MEIFFLIWSKMSSNKILSVRNLQRETCAEYKKWSTILTGKCLQKKKKINLKPLDSSLPSESKRYRRRKAIGGGVSSPLKTATSVVSREQRLWCRLLVIGLVLSLVSCYGHRTLLIVQNHRHTLHTIIYEHLCSKQMYGQ